VPSPAGASGRADHEVRAWARSATRVRLEPIDRSTLRVEIAGPPCDPVALEVDGRRVAELVAITCGAAGGG
jgi:hypothetical protein